MHELVAEDASSGRFEGSGLRSGRPQGADVLRQRPPDFPDLVRIEVMVGGLQGLVEHVETGSAHVDPPMIAPRFCSGNALSCRQFQCPDIVFSRCENVPASAGMGESSCGHAAAGGAYPGASSDWNFISSLGAGKAPCDVQLRLAISSSASSSLMAATMLTTCATRPLGSGRPAFIKGSSLASQACASASSSAVVPVAMISVTTSSSSSPSIAVTSLRVTMLMARCLYGGVSFFSRGKTRRYRRGFQRSHQAKPRSICADARLRSRSIVAGRT